MLGYAKLCRYPSIFRSFTGLDLSEFDSVYAEVEKVYSSFEEKRLSRRARKREIGAGHPFKLPLRDRLLVLLIYYRLYVTSTLLGFLFDLGQTNVLKDIRMIEPAVRVVWTPSFRYVSGLSSLIVLFIVNCPPSSPL